MLHECDECMQRLAYFSCWGLLMLSENEECMQRLAYYSLWWLNGEQGQFLSWLIMCVCLLLQHTSVSWTYHRVCRLLVFSIFNLFFRAYKISRVNPSASAMTYHMFCSRLQHLKREHASKSVPLIPSHVCVLAFCSSTNVWCPNEIGGMR